MGKKKDKPHKPVDKDIEGLREAFKMGQELSSHGMTTVLDVTRWGLFPPRRRKVSLTIHPAGDDDSGGFGSIMDKIFKMIGVQETLNPAIDPAELKEAAEEQKRREDEENGVVP